MNKYIDYSQISPESKDALLKACFDRFNSISKSDYDVAFFHLLMENGYGDKTDFELSRLLKLTETKVKNLRYRCNLEYPEDDDYNAQLKEILNEATYKIEGNRIQFSIKDKILRSYANNLLEEDGNFADSSFNSSIVSLTPMDMVDLMKKLCGSESNKDYEKLRKLIRKSTRASLEDFPQSGPEKLRDGAAAFIKDVAGKVAPRFTDVLADALFGQIEQVWNKLTKK